MTPKALRGCIDDFATGFPTQPWKFDGGEIPERGFVSTEEFIERIGNAAIDEPYPDLLVAHLLNEVAKTHPFRFAREP
ncbi:MAG TPA: hypothetical protein VM578_09380 [Candidatus Saccharimonadales bacterium]|nr:hypothetical protein [Candidatus Saccharimonadales bacterium]